MGVVLRNLNRNSRPFFRKASAEVKGRNNFIIYKATKKDYKSILDLMARAYFPDEPISNSIGYRITSPMEHLLVKAMSQGLTLMSKCKCNGNLVGACINETATAWDPDVLNRLACEIDCPKTSKILRFYAYIMRAPALFEKYGALKIFESSHLFVRENVRGSGLAGKMLENSRILAADCGYPLYRVDATSKITANVCKKMKLKMVYEIPYSSYVGADLKPVFRPPPPNEAVYIFVDDEPQKNTMHQRSSVFVNH